MKPTDFRSLWVVLTAMSLLGLVDLPQAPVFTQPVWLLWIEMLFIATFKGAAFTALLALCRPRWLRIPALLVTGVYVFLCLVNAISYSIYGFGITHRLATVVMQTTVRETMEFLPSVVENILNPGVMATILGAIGTTALLAWLVRKLPRRVFTALLAATSVIGLGTTAYYLLTLRKARASFLVYGRTARYSLATYRDNLMIEEIVRSTKPLPHAEDVRSSHDAATVMLVIGESASRGHHSLYGYCLPTTPRLDAMRDSLYIFTDAIGSSSGTAGNMERILSLKIDDTTKGDGARYPLLFDLFNAAGYKTFWLSNQEKSGLLCNASGVMASHASVVKYIGNVSSEENLMRTYDEALLPLAAEALSDTAQYKFIGLHLMGSHTEYRERYPEQFGRFTAKDILTHAPRPWLNESKAGKIAEYDNSICYTDSILGVLIRSVAAQTAPAVLIYLSDHGEDVYDNRDFRGRDRRFVEVPMIVYANAAYREANPDIAARIAGAADTPLSTASIAFPLMTITGTSYPLYDAANDFLSPSYVRRPRYVDEEPWQQAY